MIKRFVRSLTPYLPSTIKRLVPLGVKRYVRSKGYGRRDVLIDIVGSCNLGCPSCPSGVTSRTNRGGRMSLNTFEKILVKVATEYPGTTISLFNWTEPLLHPQVCDFLKLVHQFKLKSRISTNLNILKDPDAFAAAEPDGVTISLSGFTQDTYSIGHKEGDIDVVKENMHRLSDALRRAQAKSEVTVYYHKYLHNLHEEKLMREYAESLGFLFGSGWAYYMPIERVMSYLDGSLGRSETDFIENHLALDLKEAVSETVPYRRQPCSLATSTLTMDCRGEVQLCCAVYDQNKFSIGSYLNNSIEGLEEKISEHSYCTTCMERGLHVYAAWHGHEIRPIYEGIADRNSAAMGAKK